MDIIWTESQQWAVLKARRWGSLQNITGSNFYFIFCIFSHKIEQAFLIMLFTCNLEEALQQNVLKQPRTKGKGLYPKGLFPENEKNISTIITIFQVLVIGVEHLHCYPVSYAPGGKKKRPADKHCAGVVHCVIIINPAQSNDVQLTLEKVIADRNWLKNTKRGQYQYATKGIVWEQNMATVHSGATNQISVTSSLGKQFLSPLHSQTWAPGHASPSPLPRTFFFFF